MMDEPMQSAGVVSEYNQQKQYGWVTFDDGNKALFTVQVLRFSGLQTISPGAQVVAKWLQRPKSKQIYEFVQVRPA